LLLVSLVVFGIMRILPGDPAVALLGAGGDGSFTEADLIAVRKKLGTDRPLHVQYLTWMRDMGKADFGDSFFYSYPVSGLLITRFPATAELAILALLMSYVVALPLGVLSAMKQDSWMDYVAKFITISGVALPTFWVGILIIFVLARFFNWLPPLDYAKLWDDPFTNLQQLVFPALALGFFNTAFAARITRSSMLEVMREDYIRTARSKGLAEIVVVSRHALKNAFLPVITVAGFQLSRLLGGAVIIEAIFAVPGMGNLLIEGVVRRDYPTVQAMIMLVAVSVLLLNLVIDLLYGWLNPRIRYA